jgi:excisionase family DNA binding protein
MTTQALGTPLPEAAKRLGLTTDVIRKRIAAGKLPARKVDGRWYLQLEERGDQLEPALPSPPDGVPAAAGTGQTGGRKIRSRPEQRRMRWRSTTGS